MVRFIDNQVIIPKENFSDPHINVKDLVGEYNGWRIYRTRHIRYLTRKKYGHISDRFKAESGIYYDWFAFNPHTGQRIEFKRIHQDYSGDQVKEIQKLIDEAIEPKDMKIVKFANDFYMVGLAQVTFNTSTNHQLVIRGPYHKERSCRIHLANKRYPEGTNLVLHSILDSRKEAEDTLEKILAHAATIRNYKRSDFRIIAALIELFKLPMEFRLNSVGGISSHNIKTAGSGFSIGHSLRRAIAYYCRDNNSTAFAKTKIDVIPYGK